MVDWRGKLFAAGGLSGQSVRGVVADASSPQGVAETSARHLEQTVRQAADFIGRAGDLVGQALGEAVDIASDKAFESAARVGSEAPGLAQNTFSWGGYLQALAILCFLLAALWFGVWLLRRYGKFNFLPRPGSLPKDALVMEAQMPLGPRKGLMVVRFLNRRLLLGVTEHQISLLTEDNAQNERQEKDFKGIMDVARAASDDSGTRDVSS